MLFQDKKNKKKKGVSEMIGYVLLVTIAIAMSVIVFTWLKGYVPTETIECSDGVSLFVKDYKYECLTGTDKLTITLKNNGRFSVSGYLIYATTSAGQELATKDLSEFFDEDLDGIVEKDETEADQKFVFNKEVKFNNVNTDENTFAPNAERAQTFIVEIGAGNKIEIVPTRHEIINNKDKLATCTKAKISQEISCNA